MKRALAFAFGIALVIVLLFGLELALRFVFDYPRGYFVCLIPGEKGLYPQNETIEMLWGSIPYTVSTNSLGMRGGEVSPLKPEDTVRIATIGDSITDGFFVDNDSTYQSFLTKALKARTGRKTEVLNLAHGGGSIDKELVILKHLAVPLEPDIVVLTFSTNDIFEIKSLDKEDLVSRDFSSLAEEVSLGRWLLTKTALGEFVYDTYMGIISKGYRSIRSQNMDNRYEIKNGMDFVTNSVLFDVRFEKFDGMVLKEPLAKSTLRAIDNYLYALGEFNAQCNNNGIELLFVYFPAYPQIYRQGYSARITELLRKANKEMSISFLDLTDTFREKGRNKALHLAPLDFHLNPDGNRVFAEAVADYLCADESFNLSCNEARPSNP